jgi:hypothetical protein
MISELLLPRTPSHRRFQYLCKSKGNAALVSSSSILLLHLQFIQKMIKTVKLMILRRRVVGGW